MKNSSYAISGIIAIIATTLLTTSAYAQPAASEPTDLGLEISGGVNLEIFSLTTEVPYSYSNLTSEQEITNALNEVDALTHPQIGTTEGDAEISSFAQSENQQLATEIASVAPMLSLSPTTEGDAEASGFFDSVKKGWNFVKKHKDKIITIGSMFL